MHNCGRDFSPEFEILSDWKHGNERSFLALGDFLLKFIDSFDLDALVAVSLSLTTFFGSEVCGRACGISIMLEIDSSSSLET